MEKGELGLKSGKGIYDYSNIDLQTYMNERSHKIIQMLKAIRSLDDPEYIEKLLA